MSDEPTADEHPHHAPQGSGTAARRSIPATRGALSEPVVPDPTAPGAAPNTERVATSGASQPAPDPHADDKHLAELTLDVLVYAPTGLLLMAVEEFPELAAKGRQKINRQLNNAKFIGKMAVTVGGRELRQRVRTAALSDRSGHDAAGRHGSRAALHHAGRSSPRHLPDHHATGPHAGRGDDGPTSSERSLSGSSRHRTHRRPGGGHTGHTGRARGPQRPQRCPPPHRTPPRAPGCRHGLFGQR